MHTCPNCGYCDKCGRSNQPYRTFPVYPTYPVQPVQPYWSVIPPATVPPSPYPYYGITVSGSTTGTWNINGPDSDAGFVTA